MKKDRLHEIKNAIAGHHGLPVWLSTTFAELIAELENQDRQIETLGAAAEIAKGNLQYLWAGWKRHGEWPPCLEEYIDSSLDDLHKALTKYKALTEKP